MNKILLIIVLILISTVSANASTDNSTNLVVDLTYGQQFLDKCSIVNNTLTTDTSRVQFCFGFVYGMTNIMATLSMQDLSTTYITKKFLTYLSEHKDQLNQRTDLLFLCAIKEYWAL
jgi:hypothetical protein